MQSFSQESLGTLLSISVDTTTDCREEFLKIQEFLLEFEKKYSRFIPGNWLDSLNLRKKSELDEHSKNMLTYSLELAGISNGYFDPTVIDLLEEIGYTKNSNSNSKKSTKSNNGLKRADYRDIIIDGNICTLHNEARIEFGGVGKGYALDVITRILAEKYSRFLVNFGGDISVTGGNWTIGLEDPEDGNSVIGTITIDAGFFCASSGAKRKIRNMHHLLDPIHGGNNTFCIGSYMVSNSGMVADSLATLACIAPLEIFVKSCEKLSELHPDLSINLGLLLPDRRWMTNSSDFVIIQ